MGPSKAGSFAQIYAAHAREVYRFALYLSGDTAAAQDIVSEVFLRVWMYGERGQIRQMRSWLFVIARNLYLQELRRSRRRQPLDDRMAAPECLEADAAARQEFARVSNAFSRLPKLDRSALLLRAMDGLPYEEIAATLRISTAAAKVKVHRARLRLTAGRRPPQSTAR